jgi:ribosome-associated translation inhibitor RaiA
MELKIAAIWETQVNQEQVRSDIKATRANQERMEATINSSQESLRATMEVSQGELTAAINSIQSEFEETINKCVKGTLASVDQ